MNRTSVEQGSPAPAATGMAAGTPGRTRGLGFVQARSLLSSRFVWRVGGTFLLRAFSLGTIFGTSILLARTVGAAQYGIYALALSWMALLAIPAMLGLQDLLVRLVAVYSGAERWRDLRGLLRRSTQFGFGASLLAGSAAALIVWAFVEEGDGVQLALFAGFAIVPIMTMMRLRESTLRGLNHTVQCQIPERIVLPALFLVLFAGVAMVARDRLDAFHLLALYGAAALVSLGVSMVRTHQLLPNPLTTAQPEYRLGEWARGSLPLLLLAGGFVIQYNTDIVMLGILSGPTDAGIYFAANRFTNLVPFVMLAVAWTLGPSVASHYAAKRMDELRQVAGRGTLLGLAFAVPVALVYFGFGETLLGLFGEEFRGGLTALLILTVAQLLVTATGPSNEVLIMSGHGVQATIAMGAGAVANVALNAALIPLWGIEGAAIATGISLVFWKALVNVFLHRHLGFVLFCVAWPSQRRSAADQ